MAAPNAQPFGSRGGMKAPNEHAPTKSGMPATSIGGGKGKDPEHDDNAKTGLAPHGTPKPVGNGKKNPLR